MFDVLRTATAMRRVSQASLLQQGPTGYFNKAFYQSRRILMGKYFLAWLLGVPAGLLVLIYVFTHL